MKVYFREFYMYIEHDLELQYSFYGAYEVKNKFSNREVLRKRK